MQQFTLSMLRHAAKKLLETGPGPTLAHKRSYVSALSTRCARDWIYARLKFWGLPTGKVADREDLRRLLDDAWSFPNRKEVNTGWSYTLYKPTPLPDFDPRQPNEQAAFENWVDKTRPSGDVDQVQRAWLDSTAYAEFNDQRKEYIERMLGIPHGLNPSNPVIPSTSDTWDDDRLIPATSATTLVIHKETTMSNIVITTPTLVNGTDISKLPDSAVYEMIRQAENEIANLESIKNKPARLKAEIEKLQAGIDALVAAMDARETKAC